MTHKKMFQFLTLALFVAMIIVLPLQATAGGQEQAAVEKKAKAEGCEKAKAEGCEKMKGKGCMMLKAIPNLSDEQKGKLEKLHAEHQAMMAAAMAEMQKKCQAHCEAVKALLTDEQKAKLPEMGSCMKEGQGGCMMMHGMGGTHMEGKEGKGCMEKQAQAKHECQKKATEEKK
ncbi:MAG: hypothetical protein NTZ12_06700 [Candidatus Aminicenantes bacterium]|nr:hypothetical protein [Candidatus Aminicenantes bacterium]